MERQDRLLAAAVLAGSNMGLNRPSISDLSRFFDPRSWKVLENMEPGHVVTDIWQSYIESDEIEDAFVEEVQGWWDRLYVMNSDDLYRQYPDVYRVVGVGLYPAARGLKRRNEFVQFLNSANIDDQEKVMAARIAIEDRWTGRQIMAVTSWSRSLVSAEDMVDLVINEMYDGIDLIKNLINSENV